MINQQLTNPKSIVVIGGSNHLNKPGGKIVHNLKDGKFKGKLYIVNPKEKEVQGIACFSNTEELPEVDLAIIVIPARYCPETINTLADQKNTRAFIILSAGFSEAGEEGKEIERVISEKINSVNGCLIGPNCIGVLNENYSGVFTSPVPQYHNDGCDLISSSGATAVFIMEAGMGLGLRFANVYSVGNAAQTSIEDILEYMDKTFDVNNDPNIKLLYIETIKQPKKLLKHATSLIRKGAKIAAIKAGSTQAGSRAAASHTGAIANSDMAVRALFKKAGIVYCSSRDELITVASIFTYKELKGKNIAIITHAGGSAVMLTDVLSKGGLNVPLIEGKEAQKLLTYLHKGSSVSNPIDFLATGTAEQLGIIIDYCEHKFDHIDAMIVVFGSAGLFDVANVYNVLSVKLDICNKPIYPVLPSVVNARKEIEDFLSRGNVNFPDEVILGTALTEVFHTPKPIEQAVSLPKINTQGIRAIIDQSSDGFLPPHLTAKLLDYAGIPRAKETVVATKKELSDALNSFQFPIVMKVVGPVHKSDVGGVVTNVSAIQEALKTFEKLMKINGAEAVLIQEMLHGQELFVGATKEGDFGHLVLAGLGGIFIEVLKDVKSGLSPICKTDALDMLTQLKGYPLLKGVRGQEGINIDLFVDIIQRISALVEVAPEISEMDINPLLGSKQHITAVDARVRIG